MWKNESELALKAFMNGDEEEAIERWQITLDVAAKENAAPCFELGQVNYYLGKVLCDRKFDDVGIEHLQKAIEIISATDSANEQLSKAKYDLANAYRRLNQEDKAVALFKDALKLDSDSPTYIPLSAALKILQKNKLASELKGEELTRLCNELEIDPTGNNSRLPELLRLYYSHKEHGKRRAEADKYFSSEKNDYDPENVVATLSNLIGKPGKIKMVGVETFTGQEDMFSLELLVDGKNSFYQQVGSVNALLDVFNDILYDLKSKSRFQPIDTDDNDDPEDFYLLTESVLEKLAESDVLRFIDVELYD